MWSLINEVYMSKENSVVLAKNETVLSENVALSKSYDFKTISGVDTLYYYLPSNEDYPSFFADLEAQILAKQEELGGYIPKDTFIVTIGEKEFYYNGRSKGFYFFVDTARWLRVGFKDTKTITNVHDIFVQLEASGIYLLGMVNLLKYINHTLLSCISLPTPQITRIDFNIFCQYDLSQVVNKEYIVSHKRYNRRDDGGKRGYQSLKIGKAPFLLRLYDKKEELKNLEKRPLMEFYFVQNGLNLNEPIWNFEFECHRDFLKSFKIESVDDAFANAEMLFHRFMKMTRLIDIATLSQKDYDGERLHRGQTHTLWEYIDKSYTFSAVPQSYEMLERVLPPKKTYDSRAFLKELNALVEKGAENYVVISYDEFKDILRTSRLWLSPKSEKLLKPFKPIPLIINDTNYLLSKNNTPIKTLPSNLVLFTNVQLRECESSLIMALHIELAERESDTSLIIKNLKMIEAEMEHRKHGQKELELWQV